MGPTFLSRPSSHTLEKIQQEAPPGEGSWRSKTNTCTQQQSCRNGDELMPFALRLESPQRIFSSGHFKGETNPARSLLKHTLGGQKMPGPYSLEER